MSFEFELDTSEGVEAKQINTGMSLEDRSKMDSEVIEAFGTQEETEVFAGTISGIYDLGVQVKPPIESLYDPADPRDVEAVEKGYGTLESRDVFYQDGKKHTNAQVLSKPQSPTKAITFAVDFPQFIIDKGKYYGESNPAPARIIMGGTWYAEDPQDPKNKIKVVNKPTYLRESYAKDIGSPTLNPKSNIYKMAKDCGLINEDKSFRANQVPLLVGKSFLFKVRVYNKPDRKDASKSYYTEDISYSSKVPKGTPIVELDSKYLHGVNMTKENKPEYLKQLRAIIKNTMRLSEGWDSSVIKKELAASGAAQKSSDSGSSPTPEEAPKKEVTENPIQDTQKEEDF